MQQPDDYEHSNGIFDEEKAERKMGWEERAMLGKKNKSRKWVNTQNVK